MVGVTDEDIANALCYIGTAGYAIAAVTLAAGAITPGAGAGAVGSQGTAKITDDFAAAVTADTLGPNGAAYAQGDTIKIEKIDPAQACEAAGTYTVSDATCTKGLTCTETRFT
jgi:hypothetical protein